MIPTAPVAEEPVTQRPHIVIVDRRVRDRHLGRGLVEAETSFATFMAETLADRYPDYLFCEELGEVTTMTEEPRLQIELVKAYINNRLEATEVVLAVRCWDPGNPASPRIFRAQEVRLHFLGGESAYRQIFRACIEQVWQEIAVHYEPALSR